MRPMLRWDAVLALVAATALATPGPLQAQNLEARARLQYLQFCMGCHGMDGGGAPTKGVPSMKGVLGRFLELPGGREFIVQVPGVMNSPLSDGDIATLMNWLVPEVSQATVPAGHLPYRAEEIRRLRATRPADLPAERQRLVEASQEGGVPIPP